MKLVSKNNYKFVTGMFWQIPDDGKRGINLVKLAKYTKHDMFCAIKTIHPTWGFCRREDMQGERRVASLGKFIVETSKLSASYANSIICFKFKSIGEFDDNGKMLNIDLYGYIVLLNGTICPDEGEYVASFEMVRESIIQKAKKHEIETLYLPFEVALSFFGIFEVLVDVVDQDELLLKIMHNLSHRHKTSLHDLIVLDLLSNNSYLELINNPFTIDLAVLHRFIEEQAFKQKLAATKDQMLKYLIPNTYVLGYTSDEIYWHNAQFKRQFNKSLITSIVRHTNNKYKVGVLTGLIVAIVYLFYNIAARQEYGLRNQVTLKPKMERPIAVSALQLIGACLNNNDKFFKDLGSWTFTSLKCNSLGAILTFNSNTDTTLSRFAALIGKSDKSIKLNGKIGTYVINYKLKSTLSANVPKEQILEHLQQSVINYGLKISVPTQLTQYNSKTVYKFSITSKQSPLFLLNHKVLNNVKLSEIDMSFDRSSGFYTWMLRGEF